MNATTLITSGMQLLGALAAGETPSTSELNDGLLVANNLLDAWSVERLYIFAMTVGSYTLPTGSPLTVGPSGTINIAAGRPVKIETVSVLSADGGGGSIRTPVKMATLQEWMQVLVPTAAASLPTLGYYDPLFPLANLYLHPIPNVAGKSIELNFWTPLTQFPDLTTSISLPPGYARALIAAFALEFAPQFDRVPSQLVTQQAMEAKAAIRALNGAMPGEEPPAGVLSALPDASTPTGGQ